MTDLINKLRDPYQPSIEEELGYIKRLRASARPEGMTDAENAEFHEILDNCLKYNRLRRALRYRNTIAPNMSYEHFEELARTGSCAALGVVGD